MKFWRRQSLTTQFVCMLVAVLGGGAACAYYVAEAVYIAEVRSQARATVDMAENVGVLVSTWKGAWVRRTKMDSGDVGSFLDREAILKISAPPPPPNPKDPQAYVEPPSEPEEIAVFHQKNPALVQRELSEVTERSAARAKFRMTSDKFMNVANAPNRFELAAMEALGGTGETEYFEIKDGYLLFARKLIATQACLRCHESPEKAPAAVRKLYPSRGYGYEVGQMAGVISVKIPLSFQPRSLIDEFTPQAWAAVGVFCVMLLLLLYFVQHSVIRPTRQLYKFSERAARSDLQTDIGYLEFDESEHDSRNEIHRLSAAVKALRESIKLAVRRAKS